MLMVSVIMPFALLAHYGLNKFVHRGLNNAGSQLKIVARQHGGGEVWCNTKCRLCSPLAKVKYHPVLDE